ncbi:MAG TPA: hypothetical protein VJZ26_15465, partial [Blastocatellia bacterium]|nr:hypothetical protein [Blastocatellia bacterium]
LISFFCSLIKTAQEGETLTSAQPLFYIVYANQERKVSNKRAPPVRPVSERTSLDLNAHASASQIYSFNRPTE